MSLNVSALPEYVEEIRLPLLGKAILGAKTARLLNRQTGIKHKAVLNRIATEIVFGNGATCGWDEAGETSLSQREITVGNIKINMSFCTRELLSKWAGYQVRVAAGEETMPFEESFFESISAAIAAAVEKAIWQGDTTSEDENLNKFDGLIKILSAEAETIDVNVAAGASAREAVGQVIAAIPAAAIKDDTVVFASPEFVMKYGQEIVNANLFHFEPGKNYDEFVIPGTSIRLIAAPGLAGTKKLVAGQLINMVYGVDMMNDEEVFDFWYSKDNQEFRLAVYFNSGTQVVFPDQIVLATLA